MEEVQTPEATTETNDSLNIWGNQNPQEQVQEVPATTEEKTEEVKTTETVTTEEVKTEEKTEPVIQEKIVEKIVEKYPEFKDDYSKALYQSLLEGKDSDVYEYLQKKNKNYDTMADVDVVKEKMKLDNPTWSDKDIDVEMKFKFGGLPEKKDLDAIDKDLDPDTYQKAVEFNEAVEQKELLLIREARDARTALEATKKNIEFPKIAQEQKEEVKQPTQEEIDELNRKWESHVEQEMPKLLDFKFKIGDEEVSYKITDEDRKGQSDYMKNLDPKVLVQDLGWIDENGNENVVKIAEDVLKLKNMEKIISSVVTQAKVSATKEVVSEIKNVDLNPRSPASPVVAEDLGAKIWS